MTTLEKTFESEKNRKALMITMGICAALLLLFFIISWKVMPPSPPVAQDLIEINLGNNEEGFGEVQPLIKGEMKPTPEAPELPEQKASQPQPEAEEKITPHDDAPDEAAPVAKLIKAAPKSKTNAVVTTATPPAPKPQKPKITYNGPGNGNGNNATEDNGYRYQGNKPNGKGDAGDPSGNKDSYGNNPGGKVGGTNRSPIKKIYRSYSFTDDLPKATIWATIKISPDGRGTFVGFAKGSTSRDARYATAIKNHLPNIQYEKWSDSYTITQQFNFNVN
ncbi:MAG: hypothetical protein WAT19_07440 [Ferruginibacter sp.]